MRRGRTFRSWGRWSMGRFCTSMIGRVGSYSVEVVGMGVLTDWIRRLATRTTNPPRQIPSIIVRPTRLDTIRRSRRSNLGPRHPPTPTNPPPHAIPRRTTHLHLRSRITHTTLSRRLPRLPSPTIMGEPAGRWRRGGNVPETLPRGTTAV